jgi:ribosome-associated translation inhibitor RaiA
MQVNVETDNHIDGREALAAHVQSVIADVLGRFADHVTHVEAHLGDNNSAEKSGASDKRCLLEARLTGVKALAVSHGAETLHQAVDGAAGKLKHALQSALGKLDDQQRRAAGVGHLSADIERQ